MTVRASFLILRALFFRMFTNGGEGKGFSAQTPAARVPARKRFFKETKDAAFWIDAH